MAMLEVLTESDANMRSMAKSNYGNNKWDRSSELNASMTITPQPSDEYTRAVQSFGRNS